MYSFSHLLCVSAGPLIENLETTLRDGGVPASPYQVGSGRVVPNFANVQLPTSLQSPAAPISAAAVVSPSQTSSNVSTLTLVSPSRSPQSISPEAAPPNVSAARVTTPPKPSGTSSCTFSIFLNSQPSLVLICVWLVFIEFIIHPVLILSHCN